MVYGHYTHVYILLHRKFLLIFRKLYWHMIMLHLINFSKKKEAMLNGHANDKCKSNPINRTKLFTESTQGS